MVEHVFHFAFLVVGLCGLANMVIAPWVHAWKLGRLATRLEKLELAIEQIDDDGDDDPDDGEPIIEENNVIAFGKKVA